MASFNPWAHPSCGGNRSSPLLRDPARAPSGDRSVEARPRGAGSRQCSQGDGKGKRSLISFNLQQLARRTFGERGRREGGLLGVTIKARGVENRHPAKTQATAGGRGRVSGARPVARAPLTGGGELGPLAALVTVRAQAEVKGPAPLKGSPGGGLLNPQHVQETLWS